VDLTLRRTPDSQKAATAAAERWFLERGLPSVLTRRGRWRRLWPRCAAMLAAWAAVEACLLGVFFVSDGNDVFIDGTPTTAQWAILAFLAAALPLAALVGWLVSRMVSGRTRATVSTAALAFAVACGIIESGPIQLTRDAVILGLVLLLTGCGVGSVLAWAVRMTMEHLSTVGTLAVRALPIVLLTALVFFNTYVWLMAANINGQRLSLAIAFLVGIAGAFVVSKTVERVRPLLKSSASLPEDSESLAGTPFAAMLDPSAGSPLTRMQHLNVVFLLAASQLIEILVVAAVGATMYLILGLIILTPPLLKEWTHNTSATSTVFGLTFPAPDSLIHMCLFLGALTFMYISARAVDDAEYRGMFLDPLVEDLHTALRARNRYLGNVVDESDSADVVDAAESGH
jgi:MFS family permease